MVSSHALICDLLGHDPDDPRARALAARPTVGEAAAGCGRGEVVPARDGDRAVAVLRLSTGELCVLADRCPHDGGLLSDGFVEADRLVCARHQWELDPRTGACPRAQRRG